MDRFREDTTITSQQLAVKLKRIAYLVIANSFFGVNYKFNQIFMKTMHVTESSMSLLKFEFETTILMLLT